MYLRLGIMVSILSVRNDVAFRNLHVAYIGGTESSLAYSDMFPTLYKLPSSMAMCHCHSCQLFSSSSESPAGYWTYVLRGIIMYMFEQVSFYDNLSK